MTAYTTIPDTDLDVDSPLKEGVLRELRDNYIATTEGSTGAPNIPKGALATTTDSYAGSIAASGTVTLSISPYAFFPHFHSNVVSTFIRGTSTADADTPEVTISNEFNPGSSATYDFDYRLVDSVGQGSLNYNDLSDTVLAEGKPFSSFVSQGLARNIEAIGEGATGAPRVQNSALVTNTESLAGTTGGDVSLTYPYAFFPMLHTTGAVAHIVYGHSTDAADPDAPRLKVGSSSADTYDIDYRYVDSATASKTWNTIPTADISVDGVVGDEMLQTARDNIVAMAEGASGAPLFYVESLDISQNSQAFSGSGGGVRIDIVMDAYSFFPWVEGSVASAVSYRFSTTDHADPDYAVFSVYAASGETGTAYWNHIA